MSSSLPEPEKSADSVPVVLVVDDSPENRYVVRRTLTRAGMDVREAGTGAEGMALAADAPDLIVLDVNLPDMTGFELCRRVKDDPSTAHVPVIHLSQSAVDDSSRVRGLEGGADAYLTDPVHGSVLVATVRALLRMRRAEDALRLAADDAQRMLEVNQALEAARTETEVVNALLRVLDGRFGVWRAQLFPTRPWTTPPRVIFPPDREPPADPLPMTTAQLGPLIDGLLAASDPDQRVFYQASGPHHLTVLPLVTFGVEMGTLVIEFDEGVAMPPRRQARLAQAAERTAQVMERARLFEQQRSIAADLQSSLLPAALTQVPGAELAAEYRAGAEQMVVGGDFYDVFPGATGWTAVIGDVAGRGAAAAARTSLARHTAREAARHDDDPASILNALNSAIDADKRRDQLDLITAICLRLVPGPAGISVSYAIAGHPLPILIRADGAATQVGRPGAILGLEPRMDYRTRELVLGPGDALCLYTDGLTESRRAGVLFGEERLMALLGDLVVTRAPIQTLAGEPLSAAAAYNELHDDDMATLVIRALTPGSDPDSGSAGF
jgi:serine phosphatase RsbU (regulator of sigma subunit)/DNA-binding response OmpR family regulator